MAREQYLKEYFDSFKQKVVWLRIGETLEFPFSKEWIGRHPQNVIRTMDLKEKFSVRIKDEKESITVTRKS